jgi:hypothetical protein
MELWKSTVATESDQVTEHVPSKSPSKSPFKWVALSVGALFGIAHLGILGHLMNASRLPVINLPVGDYTAYRVNASKEGYSIEYRSNDPRVMSIDKDIRKKNGFFGVGGRTDIIQSEEYTMDGARHLQGGSGLGKLTAKNIECIKAEGGGQNAGRLVGASMGAAAAPWFSSIPYIGFLAAGWAVMLGQDQGAKIGGDIANMIKDCDIDDVGEKIDTTK